MEFPCCWLTCMSINLPPARPLPDSWTATVAQVVSCTGLFGSPQNRHIRPRCEHRVLRLGIIVYIVDSFCRCGSHHSLTFLGYMRSSSNNLE
ncbi:hypothetical protein LY78DRAFT_485680 [Colletotrichum sublineola]|nr:hypothetical protein LY78DRAFT_485680 [Colletotrichum sublineola]